jgi:hypothetical protein
MKKIILVLLLILPAISWGQLDGYLTPGPDGHLKVPSLTTAQILAINQPKEGMQAYDKTVHCMKFFNGISWICGNATSASGSELIPNSCVAWQNGIASSSETPITVKSDADGNILSLIYDATLSNLKLKKFTPTGTFLWETFICNIVNVPNGYLKIKNVNEIIVVAFGSNFNNGSSTFVNYKLTINDAGTVLSSALLVPTTINIYPFNPNYTAGDDDNDIEFDSDGNMIIVGNFRGTRTFGTYILTTPSEVINGITEYKREHYIVKINPSGVVLWAYQWTSNNADNVGSSLARSVFDLEIDENNDLFVSCNSTLVSGNCVFKSNATTSSIPYTNKTLLIKFKSTDGAPQWVYSRTGIVPISSGGSPRTIVKTAADGVYLIGNKTLASSPTQPTNYYVFSDKINKATKAIVKYSPIVGLIFFTP